MNERIPTQPPAELTLPRCEHDASGVFTRLQPEGEIMQQRITEPVTAGDAFSLWGQEIWRLLRFVGVPERVLADATHDTFAIAHQRWQGFRGEAARKTWLVSIALRVASNYRRRHARAADDPALAVDEAVALSTARSEVDDPFECTARAEVAHVLQQLLDELPELERQLVVLTRVEDWSVVEAAALLSIPERQARRLLERACLLLRERLTRWRARDQWRLL